METGVLIGLGIYVGLSGLGQAISVATGNTKERPVWSLSLSSVLNSIAATLALVVAFT